MKENLVINPEITDNNEETLETTLRPQLLEEYIGQTKVKESMKVFIEAAKQRGESLDHVLLYGPPGLCKTSLAGIIANEMSKIKNYIWTSNNKTWRPCSIINKFNSKRSHIYR